MGTINQLRNKPTTHAHSHTTGQTAELVQCAFAVYSLTNWLIIASYLCFGKRCFTNMYKYDCYTFSPLGSNTERKKGKEPIRIVSANINSVRETTDGFWQEPITRSTKLPCNRVTAFLRTCLFLDLIFDKFRLPREPRLFITSIANLIIKLSVIKSPEVFFQ